MGQKGHIIVQKGLKMHEKRQKIEFSNLKYLLFSGMFLSGIGGYQIFKYSRYIFKGENVIYLWGGFPKSWQISLKKSLIFSLHNPVHAKCANFCFVGKEWPRNGYRFSLFFMPNQGGCFNLKCTGQQKGFFFCPALNMGRPVEKGCPLWHRKEIQSLYIGGPVGYLQFSSAPQTNSLRGKFQRHLKTFGL